MMVTRRDHVWRRWHQLLDRVGLNRGWPREMSAYYRQMTIQEFWFPYTIGRMDAATLWEPKSWTGESDYRAFYAETDYFVLRQMFYSRNECYYAVADSMRPAGGTGDFCEYCCGVAPVTAWRRPRFPRWRYTLVDLPTPMLNFARWRFREASNVEAKEPGLAADLPLTRDYDVITCMDVLEHVINPLEVVKHLAEHLKPVGTLHLNFSHAPGGENLLESAAQRAESIRYLDTALRGVVPLRVDAADQVYARYVRPR